MKDPQEIFNELFVLELANNHWGSLERGAAIVHAFAPHVKNHGIKAAIKLQFRDRDTFVHKHYYGDQRRYIAKSLKTMLSWDDNRRLLDIIRSEGLLTAATPFDETSARRCVDKCDVDIVKVASSDIQDWPLLNAVIETRKPVILSTGGAVADTVNMTTTFLDAHSVNYAINHCVSLYPSADGDLCLNQIDVLRRQYPMKVIGFSSHEYWDWRTSMLVSYAKGARMWERHIDIHGDPPPALYSTTPLKVVEWFMAFKTAKEVCGPQVPWREISPRETAYLNELHRGRYASRRIAAGEPVNAHNTYLAIPALQGQVTCNDVGWAGKSSIWSFGQDDPIMLEALNS